MEMPDISKPGEVPIGIPGHVLLAGSLLALVPPLQMAADSNNAGKKP